MHSVTLLSIGLLAAIARTQSSGEGSTGSDSSSDTSGNPTLQSGDDDSAMSSGMVTSTMAAMSSGSPAMSATAAAGEPAEPTAASLAMPSATGSSGVGDRSRLSIVVVAGVVLVGGAAVI